METTSERINRKIRALMAYRSLSAEDFCQSTGMNRSAYYRRMRGDGSWSADELERAAEALGVDVADLFKGIAA